MHSEKCNKRVKSCAFMEHIMEKFESIERKCLSSNLSVAHVRENRFSPDTQHRPRKSPRKKLKATRASASLVIEQLKSGFRRSGDFAQRTRRNWRPEFLIEYLWNNRHSCKEELAAANHHRCDKSRGFRNLIPQTPKICSIGLRLGARSLNDSNDWPSSYSMIRNLKKRLNIVRRPAFMCKYWALQATSRSSSAGASLDAHKSHQPVPISRAEPNISKQGEIPNSVDRLCEHSEEGVEDTSRSLRDSYAAGDRSFAPDALGNPSAGKDPPGGFCVKKRDAQIQTSVEKRRKRTRKRPKLTNEKSSYFGAERCNADKGRHCERPRLSAREVLESKRAEYIDKFTAVSRRIEEITAALRETCYTNSENNDEYRVSTPDDAKEGTKEKREPTDDAGRTAKRSTARRKTRDSANVIKVTERSRNNRHRNADLSADSDTDLNDGAPHDCVHAFTIKKKTVRSSNRTGNTQNFRSYRQISFDLDLTRDDDGNFREFSHEGGPFDEIHSGSDFVAPSVDARARDFVRSFAEKSKYKIIREKAGETIILKDIKRRIDRDFDDPTERSENDAEEFPAPVKSGGDFARSFYKVTPDGTSRERTLGEVRSTPLLAAAPPDLDSTGTHVRDSKSYGSVSECSNKTSTLSRYFSCGRLSSSASFEGSADNPTVIASDSRSNPNLRSGRCDLASDADVEPSSLNSIVDRAASECVARHDAAGRRVSSSETNDETPARRGALVKNPTRGYFLAGTSEGGNRSGADKRCAADSALETSRHNVDSIDSGVFSSSLIDLRPPESSSFSAGKSELKKRRRNGGRELGESSSPVLGFSSDSGCTDDTLDRRVDDVVRDLTKNLILCERRANARLKEMRGTGARKDVRCSRYALPRVCKFSRRIYDTCHDFFISPRRSSEDDERIVNVSTPSLLSLSDSENEDNTCRL